MSKSAIQFLKEIAEKFPKHRNVLKRLKRIAVKVADKYQNYSSDKYRESPSSPDTSKFVSRKYSMIVVPNKEVVTYRGPGGMFTDVHPVFIQIGSDVPTEIFKSIVEDFKKEVMREFKLSKLDEYTVLEDEDGTRLRFNVVSGTSWGGVGFAKG